MTLSREQVLALRPTVEEVELEDHGTVRIRGLTAAERDAYEQTLVEVGPDGRATVKAAQRNVRASLVVRCLVDDAGERMFADDEVEALGEIDGAVIDKLWDVARRLSGMSTEAEEAALAGFGEAQDAASSTG